MPLPTFFKTHETVQAVCPILGIWFAAKIESFMDDWTTKVSWPKLPGNEKSVITITESLRVDTDKDLWNLRKPANRADLPQSSKRSRCSHYVDSDLTVTNPRIISVDSPVFYVEIRPEDHTDRHSANDRELLSAGLKKGWVIINDPFLAAMDLFTSGEDEPDKTGARTRISYHQLRKEPNPKRDSVTIKSDSADFDAAVSEAEEHPPAPTREPVPKRARVESSQPKTNPAQCLLDSIVQPGEIIELTSVPCSNGILELGAVVQLDCCTKDCTTVSMVYNGTKKLAMVEVRRNDNEDISITLPAYLVRLKISDYKPKGHLDFFPTDTDANKLFKVLCVIKHIIGLSPRKSSLNQTVVVSDDLSLKFLGLHETTKRNQYGMIKNKDNSPNSLWTQLLGKKWDLLENADPYEKDTAIMSMRFYHNKEYGIQTIKVLIHITEGNLHTDENFRELINHNIASSETYYMP